MTSVQSHYDHHLGRIYGWMIGDFNNAVEAARQDLRVAGLEAGDGRSAVDLGAGLGTHAIALAEAGYTVTAIDTSAELLDRLRSRGDDRITCVDDDLMRWRSHRESADVLLCMGDTLTHLPSQTAVAALLETVADGLKPGGVFVTTFRDYHSSIATGETRFIPVKADDDRILTCVLEYGWTKVKVHDLLHERTDAGWMQSVSSYVKLRLSPELARATLERLGLVAVLEAGPRGMIRLIARRSRS